MKNNTNTDYFQNTHKVARNDIQDSYYKISTTLNNLKKEILQQIVLGININNNFYNNVHNITDKLQQRKFKHKFASSSLTTKPLTIRLPKIFNHPEIIETLLHNLQEKESIPTVTYRRDKTIKDNI